MNFYVGKARNTADLGLLLQQGRLVAGLTQRELAARLGTSQSYIWDLENGKDTKALERLFEYIAATNMKMELSVPRE